MEQAAQLLDEFPMDQPTIRLLCFIPRTKVTLIGSNGTRSATQVATYRGLLTMRWFVSQRPHSERILLEKKGVEHEPHQPHSLYLVWDPKVSRNTPNPGN